MNQEFNKEKNIEHTGHAGLGDIPLSANRWQTNTG